MPNKRTIEKKRVTEFIKKNRLMSLATLDENGNPWSATLFFAYDENFNIYFYSKPDTKHSQNINRNENVSLTISHHWGKEGEIQGIQYVGKAKLLKDKEELNAYKLYCQRLEWAPDYRSDHLMYKIIPEEVWMIDSEITGNDDRVRVY